MSAVVTLSPCLTRVMSDDDASIEVAQLARIVERIQCAASAIPIPEREYVAKALLAYALNLKPHAIPAQE